MVRTSVLLSQTKNGCRGSLRNSPELQEPVLSFRNYLELQEPVLTHLEQAVRESSPSSALANPTRPLS